MILVIRASDMAKTKKPPGRDLTASFALGNEQRMISLRPGFRSEPLLQFVRDRVEGVRHARADRSDGGDDGDGDQGCDQTIFNGRGTRFTLDETANEILHDVLPTLLALQRQLPFVRRALLGLTTTQ